MGKNIEGRAVCQDENSEEEQLEVGGERKFVLETIRRKFLRQKWSVPSSEKAILR